MFRQIGPMEVVLVLAVALVVLAPWIAAIALAVRLLADRVTGWRIVALVVVVVGQIWTAVPFLIWYAVARPRRRGRADVQFTG